jgi:2-polyprenyl-3-methyl-5-hydroxy-6-metoxy-1,4-benzoquinol methylase
MTHRDRLLTCYCSTHYVELMPRTADDWNWVLERLEVNFGHLVEPLPRDTAVLDVGCGVGYLEHWLLARAFSRIRAIDVSEEQVQAATRLLREHGWDAARSVDFRVTNAFDDLRGGARYGLVALIDVLEHIHKPGVLEMLRLVHGALEPSGLLLLRVINADNPTWGRCFYRDFTHETPFTPESLRQCLAVSGLVPVALGYEVTPRRHHRPVVERSKEAVRRMGQIVLAPFLGIRPAAFAGDLVAVAKKP